MELDSIFQKASAPARVSLCRCVPSVRITHSTVFLAIIIYLCSLTTVFGAGDSFGNEPLVRTMSQSQVGMEWGVADTTASVGRLLTYHIPKDAFSGDISHYKFMQMSQFGESELPSWLYYDRSMQALRGIPSSEDKGRLVVGITAVGNKGSEASDVFTILVNEDVLYLSSPKPLKKSKAKPVNCQPSGPFTSVTIVVDTDLGSLLHKDRVQLLEQVSVHLHLSVEMLKVKPVGDSSKFDSSALVSGPGDSKTSQFSGSFVSWLVGCGNVENDHMQVLEMLEKSAASGEMANTIGHPIVGWHVSNHEPQLEIQKRSKRQVRHISPTPVIVTTPPTKVDMTALDDMVHPTPDIEATYMTISIQPTKSATSEVTETPTEPAIPKISDPPFECPTDGTPTSPVLDYPVDPTTFFAGEFARIKIPRDTFSDCTDGNTRNLKLLLLTSKMATFKEAKVTWLRFDVKKQHIVLMATNREAGNHEFLLIAENSHGSFIQTEVYIVIIPTMKRTVTHEFAITIDTDYDEFMADVRKRIEFSNKIAKVFGDKNSKNMIITRMNKGSVIFAWTNSSLPTDSCPSDEIKQLQEHLINENGTLTSEAEEILKPYVITDVTFEPTASCRDVMEPVGPTLGPDIGYTIDRQYPDGTTAAVDESAEESDDNLWVTTVVPAVVIAAILFIALIIACVLYRKRRKGKMEMQDHHTFVNKGVPVIFADELEDKPSDASKPLIMDEEKPPYPPPEYQQGGDASTHSTPPIYHKDSSELDEHRIEDENDINSPLYRPPPPVTASNENKQPRPHVQPVHRSSPPYVPP